MKDWPTLEIKADDVTARSARVLLNGEDVSGWCKSITLHMSPGDLNLVTMEMYAGQVKVDAPVALELLSHIPRAELLEYINEREE